MQHGQTILKKMVYVFSAFLKYYPNYPQTVCAKNVKAKEIIYLVILFNSDLFHWVIYFYHQFLQDDSN